MDNQNLCCSKIFRGRVGFEQVPAVIRKTNAFGNCAFIREINSQDIVNWITNITNNSRVHILLDVAILDLLLGSNKDIIDFH